jgi:hypothetical protein
MPINLFIDDERFPPSDGKLWVIARTSYDAINIIKGFGMPKYISFDHDLGGDDTSMKVLRWMEEQLIDREITFPEAFDYYVHSQNPVGVVNITAKMETLLRHFS